MSRLFLLCLLSPLAACEAISDGAISGEWTCSGIIKGISYSQSVGSESFTETVYITDDSVDWFCEETIKLHGDPDSKLEADQKLDACTFMGDTWDLNEMYFRLDDDGDLVGEFNVDHGQLKLLGDFTCTDAY